MSVTILTLGEIAKLIFLGLAFLAFLTFIPFLTGIVVRIFISNPFLSDLFGVLSAITLTALHLIIEGYHSIVEIVSLGPDIIYLAISVPAFALLGVRSASAFYSGMTDAVETGDN